MRATSMGVLGALLTATVLVATVAAGQNQAPQASPPPLPAPAGSAQPPASSPSPAPAPEATPPSSVPPAASEPASPSAPSSAPQQPPPPPPPESEAAGTPLLRKHVHDGFYLGIGTGVGAFALWGDGPFGSASISGLGMRSSFAVGGSPIPGLAIVFVADTAGLASPGTFNGGTQVFATSKMVVNGQVMTTPLSPLTGHSTSRMALLGAGVDWYPVPTGGWHAGASVGLGVVSIVDDGGNNMAGLSVGASLFGGYQFSLGGSWSLGVSGFLTGAPSVKLSDSNQNDLGYRMTPLSGGIQSLLLYY